MNKETQIFLRETALQFFLNYITIETKSDPESDTHPSSSNQFELGKIIVKDLHQMGIVNAHLDQYGYIYASVPASAGVISDPISFIAHLDTSPSESGTEVKPVLHKNYQGEIITFPDDPELTLTLKDSPELNRFFGEDIITASGKTLLGADDKAGIAEIMAACALLIQNPSLPHPELRICFTPDEEIGRGVDNIDLTKLGKIAYTLDGGELGELEAECFDAWSAHLTFTGRNVHPGSAKNVMINAAAIAARFSAEMPEWQTPERTERKEGFYHLTDISGDENKAQLSYIIRDFTLANNEARIAFLTQLVSLYELRYPGMKIELNTRHTYQNMFQIISAHPEVVTKAARAITDCGIDLHETAIRGGTDGARLSYMGIPTPNIFAGGLMFHSRREWIPVLALQKAAEVIIRLAELYSI